jgi:threonine 3-dehydrogenase
MKGLVKKHAAPGLWMEEVPAVTPADDEVLIKTRKTSICGTDVHIYKWDAWAQKNVPTPMIIGHEFMGEIVALGKGVQHLEIGTRVTGEGHITCGTCYGCRSGKRHLCSRVRGFGYHSSGCFAEYFTLPAANVFTLPSYIPDDIAAIFDPFGNAVHTSFSVEHLTGESVLITGAGPIGIMATAIAHKAGARHIIVTDVNPKRLAMAARMGATTTLNISEKTLHSCLQELGLTEGVSVGLEMSGSPAALQTLLEAARPGATIALLGILPPGTAIDWDLVIFKMLTLKGIYGREIFSTWDKMVQLIAGGLDLAPIITHRFPVDEYEKGFAAMLSGEAVKVILEWS